MALLVYRAELIDYIESHNMTLTRDANLMETDSLERIVKKHMEDCKSGAREEQKKLLEEVFGKQDNLSGIFGGC